MIQEYGLKKIKNNTNIIRADVIKKENFDNLKNISIFIFKNNKFAGRIDGDNVSIRGKFGLSIMQIKLY